VNLLGVGFKRNSPYPEARLVDNTEPIVQDDAKSDLSSIIDKYKDKPETLMYMLLELQKASGNAISDDVAVAASKATGVPASLLYDFTHFYSMFSDKQRGKYIIRLCNSAPCHVCGSAAVAEALMARLGVSKPGETTADGLFTFEYTQCLGVCDVAPAVIVGEKVHGNLDETSARQLVADLRKEAKA